MSENEALPEQADQNHAAAVEYACSIVADVFGSPPQQICRFLFKNGPSTLREVGMGTELPKSVVSKGLMVLVQHSFIEALLHDQVGENRRIISNTVYKVIASRIFAFVRQPAFLVHIADTLGPLAEKTCQQLVAYGRLDFRGIVDHILAEEQEHAAGEEGEGRPSTEQTKEALACIVMKLLQRRLVEQARSRARQPKISDEQRKLDSAHQLTVAQYQKLRYKYPEEVLRSATPDGTSENVDAKEMVLLRLNVDAFAVHFRHEACVNFVSAAHGENVATVVQAMMDLTRDNDLTRMGKGNVAASSVSLEAVAQQVRHNKRKERVARDDTGSAAPMEVDTTPSGTPGGTPSVENSDVDDDGDEIDVDTAMSLMEDTDLVRHDDDQVACFIFDQSTVLLMARSNMMAGFMKHKFGERGHRVWRIILEHKYLQVDAIEKLAMLNTRDVRTILHVLFQQGYLSMQELPRTADRTPSKTVFLYNVSFENSLAQLRRDLCTAAANLLKRAACDTEQHKGLLALVQRQVAGDSVRLSSSQIKSASAWQNRMRFIYASLLSLDSMFRMYF